MPSIRWSSPCPESCRPQNKGCKLSVRDLISEDCYHHPYANFYVSILSLPIVMYSLLISSLKPEPLLFKKDLGVFISKISIFLLISLLRRVKLLREISFSLNPRFFLLIYVLLFILQQNFIILIFWVTFSRFNANIFIRYFLLHIIQLYF